MVPVDDMEDADEESPWSSYSASSTRAGSGGSAESFDFAKVLTKSLMVPAVSGDDPGQGSKNSEE